MHRRRVGIVGGLRLVDIVVGVDFLFHIIQGSSQQYMCAVGNHLIRIHVGLSTRTGLPDDQRKLAVVLPSQHLVTYLGNNFRFGGFKDTKLRIGQCCRLLQDGKGMDDFYRHAVLYAANLKIIDGTLRLRSPVS